MECTWHAGNLFLDVDTATLSTCWEGRRWSKVETPQPGSAGIPAGMGTPWDQKLIKHRAAKTGEAVLLLKQQLGWNHSPQINLVHYNLIVRLTHTSTPKLCPGTQRLGSLGGLFQPQGSCDSPHLSGYWFNYILDRLVGHKGPRFLGVLTDTSNPRDWGNPSFMWSVQKTPTSGKHSLLTVPAKGIPNSCPSAKGAVGASHRKWFRDHKFPYPH